MTHPRRHRTATSRRIIERLRGICLALPEATEQEAWGEPTWRVKGRLFAQLDDHHHGAPHCSVWLPAGMDVQDSLVAADPQRFFRPPYVGHKGWVGVRLDRKVDWEEVAEILEDGYRMTAPKRLCAALDGKRGSEPPSKGKAK